MTTRALVLGGGGVAGIAWETGVLLGIADESPTAARALLGVGRAARDVGRVGGGRTARQWSGVWTELFDAASRRVVRRNRSGVGIETIAELFLTAAVGSGRATLDTQRRCSASVRWRWPPRPFPSRSGARSSRSGCRRTTGRDRELRITAIDVDTGELAVFDRDSGVDLVDAVAASCAVPGAWPPVTIADRRYMDGGVASSVNLGVADDCATAVVLVPPGVERRRRSAPGRPPRLARFGGAAFAVFADAESLAAFGPNPLDPGCRPSALPDASRAAAKPRPSPGLGVTALGRTGDFSASA